MKRLKTAIVGCGGIAQVHEKALEALDCCEISACVDIVPEKAFALAEKCGARAYVDMVGMLAAERPDVVHLCTPHALHVPQALTAVEAGAAVFTEKPPAVSRSQWAQLVEAGEKAPVGVCFQNRYNPNVLRAEELLAEGGLGEVLGVRGFLTWRRDAEYYRDGWHGVPEMEGGGALMNQAIHTLDLVIRFLGKPDSVQAGMANHHLRGVIPEEDTVEMFLQSGAKRGLLYASCASAKDEPVIIDITAERGSLRLEEDTLLVRTPEKTETIHFSPDPRLGRSYWGSGHLKCIADFYRSLTENAPIRNSVASCTDTMEALFEAYGQCEAGFRTDA